MVLWTAIATVWAVAHRCAGTFGELAGAALSVLRLRITAVNRRPVSEKKSRLHPGLFQTGTYRGKARAEAFGHWLTLRGVNVSGQVGQAMVAGV